MDEKQKYVHALSFRFLDRFYDPLIRLFMREAEFKNRLIQIAQIEPGSRVLDLGCGTATLTLMIKQQHPSAEVYGIDGDGKIIEIARRKAARADIDVKLDEGMAFDLPYEDDFFDRVLSSLVIHHLSVEDKRRTLREVRRVLCSKGELHIVDFGRPRSTYARLISKVLAHLEPVADNYQGLLTDLMEEAGFEDVQENGTFPTLFGTLGYLSGTKA